MEIVIYGAQGIALSAYEAIKNIYPKRNVKCFLVTVRDINPERLSDLPVLELKDFVKNLTTEEKNDTEILIATPENVMPEIENSLDRCGLNCHVRLTSVRWAKLVGFHYMCNKKFLPLSALPIGYNKAKMHVFMAKFYKDKKLSSEYSIPEWITPIQVGAALCKERVADILDCDGENISKKNVNYSELTALYWIWKNKLHPNMPEVEKNPLALSDMKRYVAAEETENKNNYYGLVHYRRILMITEDDIFRLADNDVDVVLPYPTMYEPGIKAHHERYLADADWNALLRSIRELQPEYADKFIQVLEQKYLYNYNIMLARKSVLKEYCEWLFPILERTEELSVPKGFERQDRYIGYMGETLVTLYFMVNKGKLNIVHAGCRFLT